MPAYTENTEFPRDYPVLGQPTKEEKFSFPRITADATYVDGDGKEIIAIGLSNGEIFLVDQGHPGIAAGYYFPFEFSISFNPFFGQTPFANIKFTEVMIHLRSAGKETMTSKAGVNFLEPTAAEDEESITIGDSSVTIDLDMPFNRMSTHLRNITDGFTLQLEGVNESLPAHTIQALTYKGKVLGDRNRSPKEYS